MKSAKEEILRSLIELKEKGVQIKFHESFIERNNGQFIIGNAVSYGTCVATNTTIQILKAPSELSIEVYVNSSEDEIMKQIICVKDQVSKYEKNAMSSSISEFLKEKLA